MSRVCRRSPPHSHRHVSRSHTRQPPDQPAAYGSRNGPAAQPHSSTTNTTPPRLLLSSPAQSVSPNQTEGHVDDSLLARTRCVSRALGVGRATAMYIPARALLLVLGCWACWMSRRVALCARASHQRFDPQRSDSA